MNKKETSIILASYKHIYACNEVLNIDKTDTIREYRHMLEELGLKKEMYIIENEVICERDNIKYSSKQVYEMIFETFLKYNKYIHYDMNEIERYYDDLQFYFTDEENKCHIARINLLNNYKAA
jgi:hypothetical protein